MPQSSVVSEDGNRQRIQLYGNKGDIPEGYSHTLVLR